MENCADLLHGSVVQGLLQAPSALLDLLQCKLTTEGLYLGLVAKCCTCAFRLESSMYSPMRLGWVPSPDLKD